jgi:serine protease Do
MNMKCCMKMRSVLRNAGIAMGLSFLLFLSGCTTLTNNMQEQVLDAKRKIIPSLVHIRPVKEVFVQGKRQEVLALGSGFIISKDGYVVTNEHVAGESSQVICVLDDNTELEARVIGTDPDTDIAVLKLESDQALAFARFGSSASLESGDFVLAMGSPHGLSRSASLGIISLTDRYLGELGGITAPYNNWIQTDAAINKGNSGGPLVNLKGEVIGINTLAMLGAENVGFAIPADSAREIVDAIIAHGRVQRSSLGLSFQEMHAKTDDKTVKGVVIADVSPLSPAAESGVKAGDVLVSINDKKVNAYYEEELPAVRKQIADLPVNEKAVLQILRGNEPLSIEATTEEKMASKGTQVEFHEWGFTAMEMTPELARRAQLPQRQGILVSGCTPGGLAAVSGIVAGDILLEMDDEPISSLTQFDELYRKNLAAHKKYVMLFVKRGAVTRFALMNTDALGDAVIDKEILEYVD